MQQNEYFLDGNLNEIDFAAVGTKEVLQNGNTILSTLQFTAPYSRPLGIDGNLVDLPMAVIQAKFSSKIIATLRKYEPRLQILKVEYSANEQGKLMPRVRVKVVGV